MIYGGGWMCRPQGQRNAVFPLLYGAISLIYKNFRVISFYIISQNRLELLKKNTNFVR